RDKARNRKQNGNQKKHVSQTSSKELRKRNTAAAKAELKRRQQQSRRDKKKHQTNSGRKKKHVGQTSSKDLLRNVQRKGNGKIDMRTKAGKELLRRGHVRSDGMPTNRGLKKVTKRNSDGSFRMNSPAAKELRNRGLINKHGRVTKRGRRAGIRGPGKYRSGKKKYRDSYYTQNTVIRNNYNYTNIYVNLGWGSTYVWDDNYGMSISTGDYGYWNSYEYRYRRHYYSGVVLSTAVLCSFYGCNVYTPSFWQPLWDRYEYQPAITWASQATLLTEDDWSYGMVAWLYGSAGHLSYDMLDYYRESLKVNVTKGFQYSQVYLPSQEFVDLAKDISALPGRVAANFMNGINKATKSIEQKIQNTSGYSFRLQKNDIDVRSISNYHDQVVVLKGLVDRRTVSGTGYLAQVDFTVMIDLRSGETIVVTPTLNGSSADMSYTDLTNLQTIRQTINAVTTDIESVQIYDDEQIEALVE
ncbi:hypothetical protein COB52_05005, partial [Candidatus Kaiserbacteria bacterium]